MLNEITDEIKASIQKNLPSAVGEELKKALIDYEITQHKLAAAHTEIERLSETVDDLKKLNLQSEKLDEKEKHLNEGWASLEGREAVQNHLDQIRCIKDMHADEKVNLIKGVVRDVFANNKYKYHSSETANKDHPLGPDQYGVHQSQYTTETKTTDVESEG